MFIRESDVLARFVKLNDYVIHVNPIVANGEMPHRKWDNLLADTRSSWLLSGITNMHFSQ